MANFLKRSFIPKIFSTENNFFFYKKENRLVPKHKIFSIYLHFRFADFPDF